MKVLNSAVWLAELRSDDSTTVMKNNMKQKCHWENKFHYEMYLFYEMTELMNDLSFNNSLNYLRI